jgi:hypothetical protein
MNNFEIVCKKCKSKKIHIVIDENVTQDRFPIEQYGEEIKEYYEMINVIKIICEKCFNEEIITILEV